MKKLIAYYSRAGENYFSGTHRAIAVGNTEKAARLLAELTGAELFHICLLYTSPSSHRAEGAVFGQL